MLQLYGGLAIVTLVGGLCYGGYEYYTQTQNKISALSENLIKIEMAKIQQDNTIKALEEDRDKFQRLNTQLAAKLIEASKYQDTLINKLRKHNLTALSMKKPVMIEKRINDATKKLFKHFEDFSSTSPSKSNDGVQQSKEGAASRSEDSGDKKKGSSAK